MVAGHKINIKKSIIFLILAVNNLKMKLRKQFHLKENKPGINLAKEV